MFRWSPILEFFFFYIFSTERTVSTVNGDSFALPNGALIRAGMWWGCIFRFSLNHSVLVLSISEDVHFLCRIFWEFGMMFISSVKMAFSTNFISASCVKLNKFNFVIFFKKVTIYFDNVYCYIWWKMNFPLCNKNLFLIYKWQDYVKYSFGLNSNKMFDFCLWGKKIKGWALIIHHSISLSKWKYLHFTDVLNVTPYAFHIWESSSRHYFGFKIRHSIVQTPVSFSFGVEAQTPGAFGRPSRSCPSSWPLAAPGLHALHAQPWKELVIIGSSNFFLPFLVTKQRRTYIHEII